MPPSRIYETIDLHTAGEPLRIIVSGLPHIPGTTMLKKQSYFRENFDHVRTALMLEPRGHADMYGCVLTEPVSEGSQFGVVFMHNEGYSTMCGHGIIALTTVAIMEDWVADTSSLFWDTRAGTIQARPFLSNGRVEKVFFESVPSFVLYEKLSVGGLTVDVAFGGAFYVVVDSPLPIDGNQLPEIRRLGMKLKNLVESKYQVSHPLNPDIKGIYGTVFCGPPANPVLDARNVTIFANGEVDRSPCGTGTCAVMASRWSRERSVADQTFLHESIIGTVFEGRIVGTGTVGEFDSIVPEIGGSAFVTGYNKFQLDEADPLVSGFRL